MNGAEYRSVLQKGESVFEDRKSEFFSFAAPVGNEDEAIAFVRGIRAAYPDARHCVYAYILRENNAMRYTDDGEPQGTAGMPTLDAMRKRGITDCVVATVRYFGGILLGTGGLVHAYTAAASAALDAAIPVAYATYCFGIWSFSYADHCRLLPLLANYDARAEKTEFTDTVTVTVSVPLSRNEEWKRAVTDATGGRAVLLSEEKKFDYRK